MLRPLSLSKGSNEAFNHYYGEFMLMKKILPGIFAGIVACSPQNGEKNSAKHFDSFKKTDPELFEILSHVADSEIQPLLPAENPADIPTAKEASLSKLAVLMGSQSVELFKAELRAALGTSTTPEEVRELVYQGVPYLGIGRVLPFIYAKNEAFESMGISIPEPNKDAVHVSRQESGTQKQVEIFGERMREFYKSGPEESRHINYLLAANCFGDYYTRAALDAKMRELLTFCYLYAQGDAEPQFISHAAANLRMGRSKQFLINIISLNIPYMGYPRTLNALRGIQEAAKSFEKAENQNKENDQMANRAEFDKQNIFGKGKPNTAYAKYFIGNSFLNPVTKAGEPISISNVTFEPGCRNNWHIHHATKGGGQILIVTAGSGWYQEEGKDPQSLNPGDIVEIPANVKHWHGAKANSWFSHLAFEIPAENPSNEWLEPVSDAEYAKLK